MYSGHNPGSTFSRPLRLADLAEERLRLIRLPGSSDGRGPDLAAVACSGSQTTQQDGPAQALAFTLAVLAGYVDASGYIALGGLSSR